MNVAILGTRGIPASYSGFETAVEQITSRLTARGHEVIVYCRPHVVDPRDHRVEGRRLVHLPTIRNKYLDTFVHTLLSALHAARAKPDVALFFIAGNSPLCLITRARGHPDGDQRRRARLRPAQVEPVRQGLPARGRARLAADGRRARSPTRTPSRTSSSALRRGSASCPTAPRCPGAPARETLERLGLEPRHYVLFVGRLEPENNPHLLVEAWARIPSEKTRGMKLVVVGGAPYASEYITASAARPTRAWSSPATSSAAATGSSSATPTSSARRPRWAARTR